MKQEVLRDILLKKTKTQLWIIEEINKISLIIEDMELVISKKIEDEDDLSSIYFLYEKRDDAFSKIAELREKLKNG